MADSPVFWLPWEERDRLPELLAAGGLPELLRPSDVVAVKMHFGESGGDGFIKPAWTRPVLRAIRAAKATPFLTDTNTIYHSKRSNAVGHLEVAANHGFTQTKLQTPVIIADGLRGDDYVPIPVEGTHFETVKIATGIVRADAIVALSHFKGHILCGIGGAIKNLGMGCGCRLGKFEMHSQATPTVAAERCTACGACIKRCAQDALSLQEKRIQLDESRCVGCGECVVECAFGALSITWTQKAAWVQERLAEYAAGAVAGKRAYYINFVNHITPNCDCMGVKEEPLCPDVGLLVSRDPVAIDQASYDLVVEAHGDVFAKAHPGIDGTVQIAHAERMGLGSRRYELVRI